MTFCDLEEIYREKELILDQVQRTVRSFSPYQLSFRPASGVWSIAEIVEHLSIVEPGIVRLIRSLADKADYAGGTAPAPFRVSLDDGLRTGQTGKFKTRPEAEPTGNVPITETLNTLRGVQTEFLDLRPRLAAVDLSSVKFPHRILGDLSLGQWCAFLGAHEERHLGQIRSVTSSPGFPP